jgi:aliphatic nitrilase
MVKVAVVQMCPVFLDVDRTIEKMEGFVANAAQQGAQLVVFPECNISMYPNWVPDTLDLNGNPKEQAAYTDYYRRYTESAVVVPGKATAQLGDLAKSNDVYLVTGLVEKDSQFRGVLYNSSVLIDNQGKLLGRHRKLTPVNHERQYFRPGGYEDIAVFPTEIGRLSIGICYENRNSLYEAVLGELGTEIHCAIWVSPGAPPGQKPPKDIKKVLHAPAFSYAFNLNCFCIVSSLVTPPSIECAVKPSWYHMGFSAVVNPFAEIIAEVADHEEGVAVAEIDLGLIEIARQDFCQFGKERHEELRKQVVDLFASIPPSYVDVPKAGHDDPSSELGNGRKEADAKSSPMAKPAEL